MVAHVLVRRIALWHVVPGFKPALAERTVDCRPSFLVRTDCGVNRRSVPTIGHFRFERSSHVGVFGIGCKVAQL